MSPDLIIAVIISVISGVFGGGIAGYIALRKLPIEQKALEVDIAAKVREVYDEIITDLQARLAEAEQREKENKKELLAVQLLLEQAFERITALETENDILRDENAVLKERLDAT